MIRSLTALVLVATLCRTATAEPALKDVRLGEHVYGPPVAASDLKDAVVFVEHWGVH